MVILGGGNVKGSANLPLSDEAYKRAMWGIMVAKSHNLPVLFSGAGIEQGYSESDAFLESAEALKIFLNLDNVECVSVHKYLLINESIVAEIGFVPQNFRISL